MKLRFSIISLSSCLILSSCSLGPGRQMGGHGSMGGHGGGGNPAALIALGVGVVIGSMISPLPDKHTSIGPESHYSEGVFYNNSPHGYKVIAAPIGYGSIRYQLNIGSCIIKIAIILNAKVHGTTLIPTSSNIRLWLHQLNQGLSEYPIEASLSFQ